MDFVIFIVLCLYSLLGQTFKLKQFDWLLYYIIFHIMFSLFRQVFFFATYDKELESKRPDSRPFDLDLTSF